MGRWEKEIGRRVALGLHFMECFTWFAPQVSEAGWRETLCGWSPARRQKLEERSDRRAHLSAKEMEKGGAWRQPGWAGWLAVGLWNGEVERAARLERAGPLGQKRRGKGFSFSNLSSILFSNSNQNANQIKFVYDLKYTF